MVCQRDATRVCADNPLLSSMHGQGIVDDLEGEASGGMGRYLPAWQLGTQDLRSPDLHKALGAEFVPRHPPVRLPC